MRKLGFVLAAGFAAASAPAAPLIFSGTVRAELGYGTNPFLIDNVNHGAGYGGISLDPMLTRSTERSRTTLSGEYYRQQYFNNYGHSETIGATLRHTQQLSEHLSFNLAGSFVDSDNALLAPGFDPTVVDVLTTGQRTRTFTLTAGLSWQATARDTFSVSGDYQRSTYSQRGFFLASDYDSYGGTFSYLHALNARTKVGVQVTASEIHSRYYPDSSSVAPALSLEQILSPHLTFNGNVGVIRQHVSGPFARSNTSIGFLAQLCGKYTRRQVCASVARQSAPSGFGGLRTDLSATVTGSQQLTEHSSISFTGTYDDSRSKDLNGLLPVGVLDLSDERIFQARADYNRTLTRRLSAGASVRGQWRDYSRYGSAHAIGGSLNLIYKVGRI